MDQDDARRTIERAIAKRREDFALSHLSWTPDGYTLKFRRGIAVVRSHLFRCAMLPSEVRSRSLALRAAAQHLVKQSQQTRDTSDVLIREAEAVLFETQRALRAAMSRRLAS